MATFKVESNLRHNGVTYAVGDSLNLDKDVADALVADGVLSAVKEAPAKPEKPAKAPTKVEVADAPEAPAKQPEKPVEGAQA